MVTSPESNVSLTDAEQQKIGLVQNRLTVLQGEVLEATKNLAAIEDAIAQGQKNKEYYDELIEKMKPEIVSLENTRDSLKDEIRASEQTLTQHAARVQDMNSHLDSRKKEHDSRDSSVSEREHELTSHKNELSRWDVELALREEKVSRAEEAFKKAIESLT